MSKPTHLIIADLVDTVPLTMLGNLPCPFCGSINLSRITPQKSAKHAWIHCETCGATGPANHKDQAEIARNKRAHGPEIFIRPTDAALMVHLNIPEMLP